MEIDKNIENETENENEEQIIEVPLPPGLPQSIIGRLSCVCDIGYEIKKDEMRDKEYPVITGTQEQIDYVKDYIFLFTELKLALREISRLARRFKTDVKLFTEDEELQYVLGFAVQDVSGRDRFEIVVEKPEGEGEKIVVLEREFYVYI
ncbi:conserved archael hypothetical protein [Methanococcus maripaludis C5]|uniref:Uncharacterized protein n=1 Tax=Methanococcus maripaludis (strain C5 / ATCC BAA-1333) TaxID=402880 RepID=A4FZ80_METM5|nr:hypothetical protein [Methanococcus maripaludis]ABO35514.1 conserved archael hypothetical protein [Methanococcus maripaludis C5]